MHVLRGVAEVDAAGSSGSPAADETGPDAGRSTSSATCTAARRNWQPAGRWVRLPATAGGRDRRRHQAGRTAVFLGDLVDRGPGTPGVLRLVMGMVAAGHRPVRAGQPRDQAAARAARPRRPDQPWPGGDDRPARRRAERTSAHRSALPRRPGEPLRAGRRAAGGRARRAARGDARARVRRGSGPSRCTAIPPGRPTSSACRSGTRGRRTTGAGRWCCTATRRCPKPTG